MEIEIDPKGAVQHPRTGIRITGAVDRGNIVMSGRRGNIVMSEKLGERRKRLLRHLQRNRAGATVKELTQVLGVTRTAVRQHLAALLRDGIVAPSGVSPSGGRPKRRFALTEAGREAFPRYYSWFGGLLIETIARERQMTRLSMSMRRIAALVAAQAGAGGKADDGSKSVERLAAHMDQAGYDARIGEDASGAPVIEADNCAFHDLARKHPEICQFDLALLSAYSGRKVELHECMARGGRVCRFRFRPE